MTTLDANYCYQAVLTRDPRFDGVFFVGVCTTRIYCRTVCSAKAPQKKTVDSTPVQQQQKKQGFVHA